MNAHLLSQIIPGATGKDQEALLHHISKLESFENLIVGFMLGHDNNTRFLYMSPSLSPPCFLVFQHTIKSGSFVVLPMIQLKPLYMKTIKSLLCLMTIIPSLSMFAQSKSEMPFTSSSPNANKLLRQSWVAYCDAKMEEGNNFVQQALKEDPGCAMAYASIATADNQERAENIRKAELMKLSADERLFIGGLKASRDKKPTQDYFNPLIKKYPKDDYLHVLIMFISHHQESAIQIGENIIKRNSKFAPAYNLLGYEYMNRDDMAKAEAHFDKYISLRPDLANPYDSKGDYMMRANKIEDAIPLYEKAAALGMSVSATKAESARARLKFPKPADDDKAKIKELMPATIDAYEKSNEKDLLKDYSEHALKIWGNQVVTVGLPGIRQRLSDVFKNGTYLKFDGSIQSVDGTGPIAVAYGTIESVWKASAPGEEFQRKEDVIYLLRKNSDGNWKILADHFYEAEPDPHPLSAEDKQSIDQLMNTWNNSLTPGEALTDKHLENFSSVYSQQAIEIFPNQTSNIGLANLRARWDNFKGATMETNSLGPIATEGLGRRAVAWGIANQNFYLKDSKELRKFQFPWAMILTKEKDDAWRILAIHWGAD